MPGEKILHQTEVEKVITKKVEDSLEMPIANPSLYIFKRFQSQVFDINAATATPELSVGFDSTIIQQDAFNAAIRKSTGTVGDLVRFNTQTELRSGGGTWALTLSHYTGPDVGIYTISVLNLSTFALMDIGIVDGYSTELEARQDWINWVPDVGMPKPDFEMPNGVDQIIIKMKNKNPDSSGYYGNISAISGVFIIDEPTYPPIQTFDINLVTVTPLDVLNFVTISLPGGIFHGPFRSSTGAMDEYVTVPVSKLRSLGGLWTFTLTHYTGPECGKYLIEMLDEYGNWHGVGWVDGYAATPAVAQTVVTDIPVIPDTPDTMQIKIRMADKNGSSTSWMGHVQEISGYFVPTI